MMPSFVTLIWDGSEQQSAAAHHLERRQRHDDKVRQ